MSEVCGAAYGSNPDGCYQPAGHSGTHSNQWGTTWATSLPPPSNPSANEGEL